MKQAKWQLVTLLVLASMIIVLGIILCLQSRAETSPKSSVSLAEFDHQLQMNVSQNDELQDLEMIPIKGEKKRYHYQFTEDISLVVSVDDDNNVEKVYYYIKRSAWKAELMTMYLEILIRTIHPEWSEDAIRKLALKMNDIEGKKKDQLGFLVDFKDGGYQYITLLKNYDNDLQFFIYLPRA